MTYKAYSSLLEIKALKLSVHVGQSEKERSTPQEIFFDVSVAFRKEPEAQKTDQIQNTVCYFKICEALHKLTANHTFFLIEKLSHQALKTIKSLVPEEVYIKVRVHKPHPPVKGLTKGVCYTLGDKELL